MASPRGGELDRLVAAAAAGRGHRWDADGEGVAYAVGATVVVSVVGGTAEFRLRADIAAAAARTAEASPSPRGPEWVAFSPTTFDRFTRDRIEAWLSSREAPIGRGASLSVWPIVPNHQGPGPLPAGALMWGGGA